MADNEELISQYIDRNGVQGDTDFVIDNLNKVNDLLDKIFNTKRSLGKSLSFGESIQGSQQLIALQKQLDEQSQKTIAIQTQLDTALKKINETRSVGRVKTEEEIAKTYEIKKANQDLTKEIIARTDAYKELELRANKQTTVANTAQATALKTGDPNDKTEADRLSAVAKESTDKLKAIDNSVGRNFRNVGNYTEALKILESQLAEVNAQMSQMATAGQQDSEAYSKLSNEAELLNRLVGQQENGFSSVTMEIRNSERALQTLRAEGYGTGEAFDKLRGATTQSAQSFKEFAREQKLLESEAPVLGAITLAAKALGGAYAIGAGTSALFAEGNEKVEKEINKLVAIMTILQGLEEAYRLIQQEGAIAAEFRQVKLKGLTAATEVYAFATGGAEIATESFAATLIATGIGAVIVGIVVAIGFLISKVVELATADETAAKRQKEFAEATKELNEIIQKEIDLLAKSNRDQIEFAKNQLQIAQAAGITREQELAAKLKISALEEDQAKKAFAAATQIAEAEQRTATSAEYNVKQSAALDDLNDRLKKGKISVIDAEKEWQQLIGNGITLEGAVTASRDYNEKKYKDGLLISNALILKRNALLQSGKSVPDLLKDQIAGQNSANEVFEQRARDAESAQVNLDTTTTNHATARNDIIKSSADEQRKIILETAKLEADYITSKNELVLNDDRSTLRQRLDAIKSNAVEQRRIAQAEYQNIKNDPTVSNSDKEFALKDLGEKQLKINAEVKDKLYKQGYAYYERDKEANLQFATSIFNEKIKNDEAILNSDKQTQEEGLKNVDSYLAKRNAALADSYQQQKAIIEANRAKKISDDLEQGKTKQEILTDYKSFEDQLTDLDRTHGEEITKEQQTQLDFRLRAIEKFYGDQKRVLSEKESSNIIPLNNNFLAGKISYQKYASEREKVEYDSNRKVLENTINTDKAKIGSTKINTQERLDLEEKLSKDQQSLSDLDVQRQKSVQDEKQKRDELEIKAAESVADTIKSFVDDRYENEINHIQKLIDANNTYRDTQIKNIAASTLSNQEKAAEEQRLNLETAAQNDLLQQKQRKLKHDEAVADKAFAIAQIIEQTTIAIVHALANVDELVPGAAEAEAIAIGVIGAAQLAKVAATPIPAYKEGVYGDVMHPGGLAVTGDGGEKEWITEPGKAGYWSNSFPTVSYLKPGTTVIPFHDLEEFSKNIPVPMPKVETITGFENIDFSGVENHLMGLRSDISNQTRSITRELKRQNKKNNSSWERRIHDQVYSI